MIVFSLKLDNAEDSSKEEMDNAEVVQDTEDEGDTTSDCQDKEVHTDSGYQDKAEEETTQNLYSFSKRKTTLIVKCCFKTYF